jgi:hypothetical protein
MWLQPPFFSIVEWHLGHSFVLAEIQLAVSESSSHFFNHIFTSVQGAGWWSFNVHPKQKKWRQTHCTVGTIRRRSRCLTGQSTAYSQFGAGHHLRFSMSST